MSAKVDLVTREAPPALPRFAIFSRIFPSEIFEITYKKKTSAKRSFPIQTKAKSTEQQARSIIGFDDLHFQISFEPFCFVLVQLKPQNVPG